MKYYVVDAFTDRLFSGNPAGVCLPEKPLPDSLMQQIAAENRLSETAFLMKEGDRYRLRWFTSETEIDLCGHATLATAFVVFSELEPAAGTIGFDTASGLLTVTRQDGLYWMDFPSRPPLPCPAPDGLEDALGAKVLETHHSRDLIVLLENEAAVAALKPDIARLKHFRQTLGFAVTAAGKRIDFVSRFFAPNAGVDEDPVTGSSHASLIPFWKNRLDKTVMTARQLSSRGGWLYCRDRGDRVEIGGKAVCYLRGEIAL